MVEMMVSTLNLPISGSVVGVTLSVVRETAATFGPPGWPAR